MEWEYCYVFIEKTLMDGMRASGELMRRRVNGSAVAFKRDVIRC